MNVLYIYADDNTEWNSSEVRCAIPDKAFKAHPVHDSRMVSVAEWSRGTEKALEYGEWADVMVLQRLWVASALTAIEFWKARGKTVIGDTDDGFEWLPTNISSYPYWRKGIVTMRTEEGDRQFKLSHTPLDQMIWGGKILHGITTPSKQLVEDWKRYNPNSFYVPNYLDTQRYTSVEREIVDGGSIIIGWGGSMSHLDSWNRSGVIPALKRILKKHENVKLMIAGDVRHTIPFRKQFGSRIMAVPWGKVDKWPATLATFDIGLVPLYGKYDMRRSPLKAIEYCLMGIPFVGSDFDIYDVFDTYVTKVKNQPNAWERALDDIVTNYHDVRKDNKWVKAKKTALNWDVYRNVDNIVSVYEKIQKRDALERRYYAKTNG